MTLKYMLDTNICSYIIKHKPLQARKKFSELEIGECCISSITLAELKYWVANNKQHHERSKNSGQPNINAEIVDKFVNHLLVVDFDSHAADCYGEIRSDFKQKSIVISGEDLFIGSHALSLKLTLVTNNIKEFKNFPGLRLENWI